MEETIKQNELGREKIYKLLIKFSLPCILSLLISALYNIVDQIFIGNSELGYLGNAATGIVFPITIISMAFAWCFGDGIAAYLSICQGRKEMQDVPKCIGSGISITLVISIVLVALGIIFKEPLLRLFGASDTTITLAMDYFIIILFAFPIFMLYNMMSSVIRSDGSPKAAMIAMFAGAAINIILDPIFIYVLKWGIQGAAYATVIGQAVSFALCILYFFRPKTFKLKLKCFIPSIKILWVAIKLGLSTFITQMSIVVVALVCNIMLAKFGALSVYGPDIPISVISIETKVFTIVINIVVGLILGAQPILGYNIGANKLDRVKKTYKLVFVLVAALGIVSTLIFEIFPQAIIGIFGSGDALYNEFAQKTFRIFLSLITFTCLIKMNSIFFQAVGQPIKATIASLVRDVVCFVPLVIILPQFFGIDGILYAAPIADLIAMIVTIILTVRYFRWVSVQSAAAEAAEAVEAEEQPKISV